MKRTLFAFIFFFGIIAASLHAVSIKNLSDFNFSGWYVGSLLGYAQTHVKSVDTFQTDYNSASMLAMNGTYTKVYLSGKNARVGFYGGYGYQHKSLYLGVEAESMLQNIKNSKKTDTTQTTGVASSHNITAILKDSYAVSFKGGYVFNLDSLFYLKSGIIFSRWNISSQYPYFIGSANVTNPTYTTSKRQFGLLFGTGIEKAISKNLIAGAEVSYAQYKKISYKHPRMNQSSISPSAFSFELKLSYKI
jgi:opacity protein-like surface antigen